MKEKFNTILKEEIAGAKKLFHANNKFFFLTLFFFLCFALAQIFLFFQVLRLLDAVFVARSIGTLSKIVSSSVWKVSFALMLFFLFQYFADSFRGIAQRFGLRFYQIITSLFYAMFFTFSFPVLGLIFFLLGSIAIILSSSRYILIILPVHFLFSAIALNHVMESYIYLAIDAEAFFVSVGAFLAFLFSIFQSPQK